jgi:hypothetical protein
MRFWIDIEDSSGSKQGAGPIYTAQDWEQTRRLSEAGDFRFRLPGNDERASLASLKFVARCRTIILSAVADLGAGIIDSIKRSPKSDLIDLEISGDDLFRELVYLHVGTTAIGTKAVPVNTGAETLIALAPSGWSLDGSGGFKKTYKAIYHTYDGETVLEAFYRLAELTGEQFRLGSGREITWLRKVGSAKLTHGLIIGGPFTAGETVTGGISGATGIYRENYIDGPLESLYLEDVSGSFALEPVTGGSSGATTTLTVVVNPHSGIRAVQSGDPGKIADNPNIALITSLEEIEDGYDGLIGRVYAIGSGIGSAKYELNGVTITPPSGYALGSVAGKGYYLEHTSTWSSYGIERRIIFKDIDDVDELYEQTYEYLRRAKTIQKAYRLSITKLDSEILPGELMRVIYQRWIDGYQALNIDTDLIVLESRTKIDSHGLRSVDLVVATVDAWPTTAQSFTLSGMTQTQNLSTHEQGVDAGSVGGNASFDSLSVSGNAQITGDVSTANIAVSGKIAQASQVIRAVFQKTVTDAVATSVFRIATANESGSHDGGGYSVFVHAMIGHSVNEASTNVATRGFTAQFCRAMLDAGTGVNSAVSEVMETAVAATNGIVRSIATVTMTVLETSEYLNDIQFNVDIIGSSPGTANVLVMVELVWWGFLTPPVMTQL